VTVRWSVCVSGGRGGADAGFGNRTEHGMEGLAVAVTAQLNARCAGEEPSTPTTIE
jgi:hypothetical protein